MKLYEIPNYLEKKITKSNSLPRKFKYIYFENGIWKDHRGMVYHMTSFEIEHNDWREFEETPQKKRFWRWIIDINGIKKTSHYIDDNGLDSAKGMSFPSFDWGLIKKKKIENDFIDCILVDGKWELEI